MIPPPRCAVWLTLASLLIAAGCGRREPPAGPKDQPPPAEAPAAHGQGPSLREAFKVPAAADPTQPVAGYIFGIPVPAGNYYFAKRVAYMFPRPWEERLSEAERERAIWEALILHFESFRRNISLADAELETKINEVLRSQQLTFTRTSDPAAYAAWTHEKLGEDITLFENQMRYLFQIDKLKDQMRQSFAIPVADAEVEREFLNERHHVGGEMVVFDAKEPAEEFYGRVRTPEAWDAMKASGEPPVRPVSLMTLEAYIDLWGVSQAQMDAFHALDPGAVGPPMPFGKQWCVYRLLEKRSGDLTELPPKREEYAKQVSARKQHQALTRWVEELKAAAQLRVEPLVAPTASPPPE